MQILPLFPYLSVCECLVWITEEQRHLESGVSQRDVGLWCFPTQISGTVADGDVMSSSSALLRCSHASAATFFLLPLYFLPAPSCLVYFFSISVCIFPSIFISFVARQGSRRSLAVVRLSFFFFFLWMRCVVYSLCYFCTVRWWWTHKVWPHHFLLCHLASSYWLRLSSQW